jgi:prevent-host-death family protein
MQTLNIHHAKTHLSRLVEQALAGEDIVIAKAGKPLVRLVPLQKTQASKNKRTLGTWQDKGIWIADDFDAPLDGYNISDMAKGTF